MWVNLRLFSQTQGATQMRWCRCFGESSLFSKMASILFAPLPPYFRKAFWKLQYTAITLRGAGLLGGWGGTLRVCLCEIELLADRVMLFLLRAVVDSRVDFPQ